MTGIDRVEFAYLRVLCARGEPFFAIARTRLGYVLLDRAGAVAFMRRLQSHDFGPMDLLGRLAPRRDEAQRRAEADLRRLAIARALPQRLPAMLGKHLPRGVRYINTGHSNFTDRMIAALSAVKARIAVLIHDVIPVEAPEFQRPETVEAFRGFLGRVNAHAHVRIYNSKDTQSRAQAYFSKSADEVVAYLGVELAQAAFDGDIPRPKAPYFVTIGTIEPRKNHALLLDVWEAMGADEASDVPGLVIAGHRGWRNSAVFERLDAAPAHIIEAPDLSDGALSELLTGSHGLLFPSHMEGFGLPPMEAAALGVPVVCQDLPVLKEVMGDIPIYVDGNDAYQWQNTIKRLAEQRQTPPVFIQPTWTDHFNAVLMLT